MSTQCSAVWPGAATGHWPLFPILSYWPRSASAIKSQLEVQLRRSPHRGSSVSPRPPLPPLSLSPPSPLPCWPQQSPPSPQPGQRNKCIFVRESTSLQFGAKSTENHSIGCHCCRPNVTPVKAPLIKTRAVNKPQALFPLKCL